jgi:hypothetical protein
MTFFFQDILRQPEELQRALDFLWGPGSHALQSAATAIQKAGHIYLRGHGKQLARSPECGVDLPPQRFSCLHTGCVRPVGVY